MNPQTGLWELEEEGQQAGPQMPVAYVNDPVKAGQWQRQQTENQQLAELNSSADGRDNRPLFGDAGATLRDTGRVAANTVIGYGTDLADLGAGLVDLAVQGGRYLATGEADAGAIFNDADNPWTRWRRSTFRTETKAGETVSNVARVLSMAVGPKTYFAAPVKALRLASGLDKVGDLGAGIGKLATGLEKGADFLGGNKALQAKRAGEGVTDALNAAGKSFQKKSAAANAARIAEKTDWLSNTFRDISKSGEAATWFQSVRQSTKALTQLGREKGRVATVAQALAWDAFAAFQVYGEGDDEFDETMGDALASMGLNVPDFLLTNPEDTGLDRKVKQMTEGLVTGGLLSAAMDMFTVYRYSRAYSKATTEQKDAIIRALNAKSDDLGRGIAGIAEQGPEQARRVDGMFPSNFANPGPGQMPPQFAGDPWAPGGRLAVLNNQVETERIAQNYQRDLLTAQVRAGVPAEQVPPDMPRGMRPRLPGQAGLPPAGSEMVDGAIEQVNVEDLGRPLPGQEPAGLLNSTGEMVDTRVQPVEFMDLGPRPPEPVVTQQTIRNAFQADAYDAFVRSQQLTFAEGPDGVMRSLAELRGRVKSLIPKTRVDAMEYAMGNPIRANELGVIPAADSVWMNFITNRGLSEGWASIDPDTMTVRFNRKSAVELDQGDLAAKQAESMDQLNELNRYEEWLWNKEAVNGSPQMRPEVQDNLAQKEARDAYDNWEAEQAAARGAEPDPARMDLERQAVTSGIEADQFNQAEELRLSEAELARLTGQLDDATVVREYLGTTLDTVERPQVVKAEVGRGWEVYGNDGELLGRTSTKKAADKMAEGELGRLREATLAKARQMEADATDEAMNIGVGSPVYESDLVGKIKLTDSQIDAIQKFSPSIQRQMRADWEKRTGGQAWINVNNLGGSQKTFEMTQGEMYDIIDGIKALLQTGEIAGPRARVLRNIADKMDTTMKLLEPEARAQRFANDIAADAQRFIDHGDFC
jgi:hypothetical protein